MVYFAKLLKSRLISSVKRFLSQLVIFGSDGKSYFATFKFSPYRQLLQMQVYIIMHIIIICKQIVNIILLLCLKFIIKNEVKNACKNSLQK